GGTFTIAARNVPAQPSATGRWIGISGDHVELSLTDTGEGIPPDALAKIFDPFFTTKAVGKGTGLGLSQVYGFAQQSGGMVRARSEPGSGTTLILYLPRSKQGPKATPAEPALQPASARAEGLVLVVEDNPEVADVSVTLIEQLGYRTLRAENA